jgi:AcrR family transcriptional regulator
MTSGRIRADARRNRERILLAARDAFAEKGPDAPLEEIAVRAGVGIGTLYRRFPDRRALVRSVALDLWTRAAEEAERARAEEPDAFRALARYLHRALALRIGAVMPALVGQLPPGAELRRANDRSAAALQALIDAAKAEGTLRSDAAFGDTGLLLVRLSRPLPGPFPRALDDALAHRHLELAIDGLRAAGDSGCSSLPGPAMTLEDLRGLAARE